MRAMNASDSGSAKMRVTVIRGPWWTRLLVYWVLVWLAWEAWRWRHTGSPMTALLIGLGIVWMCERYSFGCAITLFPERLVYSDRGFLFGRKVSIERGSILGAVYRRQINSDNLPWERVEVTYRDRDSEARTQALSVVTFRRSDVERILQWLPNASGYPNPR